MTDVIASIRDALISGGLSQVYDSCAPQGAALPFTVLHLSEPKANQTMSGPGDLVNCTIDIAHYVPDLDRATAVDLASKTEAALVGFGEHCALLGGGNEVLQNEETSELTYKSTQTFNVWYRK